MWWGVHPFDSSVARAFRTFDCEIPNCRAILAGAMPALKGSADDIYLTARQRGFSDIHAATLGNLILYC
jgi:hypothetical protein